MSKFDSIVDETNMLVRVRRAFKDGAGLCHPVITRKVLDGVEYIYIGTRFRISKHYSEVRLFVVEDLHRSKRAPVGMRQWNDTLYGVNLHVIACYHANQPVASINKRDLAEMIRDKMLTAARMWSMLCKRERSLLKQANREVKAMYTTARNAIKLVAKQKGLK